MEDFVLKNVKLFQDYIKYNNLPRVSPVFLIYQLINVIQRRNNKVWRKTYQVNLTF